MTLYRNKNALFITRRNMNNEVVGFSYGGMTFLRPVQKKGRVWETAQEYRYSNKELDREFLLEQTLPKQLIDWPDKYNPKSPGPTYIYGLLLERIVVLEHIIQYELVKHKTTHVMKKLLIGDEIFLCRNDELEKVTAASFP